MQRSPTNLGSMAHKLFGRESRGLRFVLCGVSLEPFEETRRDDIGLALRSVAGSRNAPDASSRNSSSRSTATILPRSFEGDGVDVASYVVEALGLALDPFPRKPGAVFDYARSGRRDLALRGPEIEGIRDTRD